MSTTAKKTIIGLALVTPLSAVIVLYANSRELNTQQTWRSTEEKVHFCSKSPEPQHRRRTDAVILFTQMRSGSSVVAEIFNQRSDVTYFYEPLQPYHQASCELELDDRLKLLEKIVDCRFDVKEHYRRAFNATGNDAGFSKYMNKKSCFNEDSKHRNFQFRDAEFCHKSKSGGCYFCGLSMTVDGMEKHCRQSLLRAMKVIYLCKLEWLVPLLSNRTVNLKIVHLVRDPRATVNSRTRHMKSPERIRFAKGHAQKICSRIEPNVIFADSVMATGPLKNQYMRIRHEDFAMRPVETAQAVYDFIGINMNPHVKKWLLRATSTDNDAGLSVSQWQGTKRNPFVVVSDWRKSLNWGEVEEIQKNCAPTLRLLGYRVFGNEKEMRDVENMPSFTAGGD